MKAAPAACPMANGGSSIRGVTATLLRDNLPVLTAVHLPMAAETCTALRGGGAWLNGKQLHASRKT